MKSNKKSQLEKRQRELEEEREKWMADKNERVSDKLNEKVKREKRELLLVYEVVAKKQSDAFFKKNVKDEKKEYSKIKKKTRDLMGEAHLDGRTGREKKDAQFKKMQESIEEQERIDQEITNINKNEALFRLISGKEQYQSQVESSPKIALKKLFYKK